MMRFSDTSTVVREDFPQFLDAIMMDGWPGQLRGLLWCEPLVSPDRDNATIALDLALNRVSVSDIGDHTSGKM